MHRFLHLCDTYESLRIAIAKEKGTKEENIEIEIEMEIVCNRFICQCSEMEIEMQIYA